MGACSDYEEEVRCADRVAYRHCGDRTARLVARVTRQLLKISQDTTNCYGRRLLSAAWRVRRTSGPVSTGMGDRLRARTYNVM